MQIPQRANYPEFGSKFEYDNCSVHEGNRDFENFDYSNFAHRF